MESYGAPALTLFSLPHEIFLPTTGVGDKVLYFDRHAGGFSGFLPFNCNVMVICVIYLRDGMICFSPFPRSAQLRRYQSQVFVLAMPIQ